MGSVALRKVGRDLWLARGRALTMVVAIAISIVALGGVLGAYGILSREMAPSFLSTNPASATLVMAQAIDDELLAAVRERPGIADAQARAMLSARAEVAPDRWLPLSLFVVEDFPSLRIERLIPVDGAWPPPVGTLLVERTALPVLNISRGQSLSIQTPSGTARVVQVSGVVSDPALAPAWQEQRGYGYVSRETLAWLGESSALDQLKVTVAEDRFNRASITATARDLSLWLDQHGRTVEEIRIPPPGEHPHQRLMNALVTVLLLFTLLLFGLSAVVVATLVSGMLSRHVRQIGAMKAIGATAAQIAAMYAAQVLGLGAAAAILSLPLSTLAGVRLAAVLADVSNVTLASVALPWWVYATQVLAGLLLPLLAACVPILRASRMTVREAVSEIGLYSVATGGGRTVTNWLSRVLGPTLVLAVRNALRRRVRLAFAVSLLAVGGGTFMAGLNVAAASDARMVAMERARGFDIDLQLSRAQPTEFLLQLVRGAPGVAYVEPLGFSMVTPVRDGDIPLASTHKDGGHGNIPMWALSSTTRFPSQLLGGRALQPEDTDAVVVGPSTLAALQATIGTTISLAVDGRTTRWRVVGVVQGSGLGSSVGIFTNEAGWGREMDQVGLTKGLRIQTTGQGLEGREDAMHSLMHALRAADIGIAEASQVDWTNAVLRNHVAIVEGALQFLGLLMGVVGAFTLASAMSTSVAERAREFGVMQTLGAAPARIVGIVVAEGMFIGALSWLGAVAVGTLLSYALGLLVGTFLFDAALPVVIAPAALGAWLLIALGASAVAGVFPASVAARMSIRETLSYT